MVLIRTNAVTPTVTIESLQETMNELRAAIVEINDDINGFVVNQRVVSDEINRLKSDEGTSNDHGGGSNNTHGGYEIGMHWYGINKTTRDLEKTVLRNSRERSVKKLYSLIVVGDSEIEEDIVVGMVEVVDNGGEIMPPKMRTQSAGRSAAESLREGTGVRVGRGGRGRRPKEGERLDELVGCRRGRRPREVNDERVDDLNGQGNDQGIRVNEGVEGVNGNVEGANRGAPDFSTIIAQQLQNLLPTMLAQVGNQGNVGNQNGNVVNENVQENVRNVLVNGNQVGCSYKEFLACNPKEYDGKGGDVVLTRWIKKMESVHDMSSYSIDQKVKYTADDFTLEEELLEVIAQKGCFELVNHGISSKLLWDVRECGKGVFSLEDEKKRVILRTNERLYGFVDVCGENKDVTEEFVWYRDKSLRSEMKGVCPNYTDFSEKIEDLMSKIENISESLLKLFLDQSTPKSRFHDDSTRDKETIGSMCYLYKHCKNTDNVSNKDEYMDSLNYDVIRMLIRGSKHKHALCFHVCDGSSEFHVYSKKGWVSFSPDKHALVVTIGDQLQ
nr:1-aminocyclopropane-1-carboxylate oxidase 5-like [Tanacetum cinerariifolium]